MINFKNAWAYEMFFIVAATLLISLLNFIWMLALNYILWIYSAVSVALFYAEGLIVFLSKDENVLSEVSRWEFVGIDALLMLMSALPLAANFLYLVPETIWSFIEDYAVDEDHSEAMKWLRFNLNPLYYVPAFTCLHMLILSLIRLILNVVFGVILAIRDLWRVMSG